jgi:hypothetical protein
MGSCIEQTNGSEMWQNIVFCIVVVIQATPTKLFCSRMFTIENKEMRLKSCTHVLDKLGNTFPLLEIIKAWKRQNGGHELT